MGRKETRVLGDQWTVVTQDGMPSVHVEHTLALTANGVEIITRDPDVAASSIADAATLPNVTPPTSLPTPDAKPQAAFTGGQS